MKKLIVCTLLFGTVFMSAAVQANAPETASTVPHKLPSSMIDGVEVPFEVLDYAQMKYQGYAVTQASKVFRGGEQVYRLRVDRDDIPDDYDSIILLYTLKWKLIGDERLVAPPKPRFVPPALSDDSDNAAKPEQRQEQERPEGGSGGGNTEESQPEPEPDEPEEPDDPDWPDDDGPGTPMDSPRGRILR